MQEITVRSRADLLEFIAKNPRNTPRVGILFAIAMTSVFADAYDLGSLSIGVASMTADLGLTPLQVGIVTSSTAIGALVSALVGGIIADRTGRYRLFIICAVLLVIAPLGVALSVNFWMILFFRILLGIAIGLDIPVAFSFMAELLTKDSSAKFINLWQPVASLSNIIGVAIALPFAILALTSDIWRYTVGFGAVIAVVALVLRLLYSEESPLWSAKHQSLETAAKVLSSTYSVKVTVVPDSSGSSNADDVDVERYKVRELFSRSERGKTLLVSICAFAQQLQYYGVGFYLPVIAGLVFGKDLLSTIVATICAQLVALVAGLIGARMTTRLGLRRLGLIGFAIVLVCLVATGLIGIDESTSAFPIFLVALMLGGVSFGPGPLSKTLAAVIYPTEIRGMGTGWSETMGRAGSITGLFFFPVLLAAVGVKATMLILAVFPVIAIVSLIVIHWGAPSQRTRQLTVNAG